MFTGRWPHELDVQWLTPLRRNFPTLAEYLGSRGYATAGFVANTVYCSYDTGLDRGFTHYEDYVLEQTRLPSNGLLVEEVSEAMFRSSDCSRAGLTATSRPRIRGAAGFQPSFARMRHRSIADSSTGCRDGASRRVPSSSSSITMMPTRPTCCPKGPRTASV